MILSKTNRSLNGAFARKLLCAISLCRDNKATDLDNSLWSQMKSQVTKKVIWINLEGAERPNNRCQGSISSDMMCETPLYDRNNDFIFFETTIPPIVIIRSGAVIEKSLDYFLFSIGKITRSIWAIKLW